VVVPNPLPEHSTDRLDLPFVDDDQTPADAENNRVAVLLMGYGEVESYEDFANYNEQALNLLTAKFAPVPTWIYPPLAKVLAAFDLHEWSHQHGNFISPHNAIFERQRAGIEAALKQRWGDRIEVFKAFNFCQPHLPEQVLETIRDRGFSKLLIYPLLVVDSIFTSGIAIEQVNKALVNLQTGDTHWVRSMRYIPSFYNQPDYIQLLARMVQERIDSEWRSSFLPSQIGIVLLNHGCPHEAKGFVSGIAESQALYEAVRVELMHRYPLISVGWLNHDTPMINWTQPNAQLAAHNLIELGAQAILMMPIGFATENHETLLDVEHIMLALQRQHPQVIYQQMPCVNDHPEFLEMAARWANPLISDLLGERAKAIHFAGVDRSHLLDQASDSDHAATHSHDHDHDHAHAGHHHHGHHHHH
jgi:ferrochelatase